MTIAPGVVIGGRIVWDGKPSLEKDELTVGPESKDIPFGYSGPSRVDASNVFFLKNMSEGPFRMDVMGQSKDCYIKEVRYGESSALEDGFVVARGEAKSLEIVISSRGARVQGTVIDADGLPLAGVTAALVPELSRRARFHLYKTAVTDQYGHFEMKGIAPGDYKLFSWEDAEEGAWEDPEFLKGFEDRGERITLQDDDQRKVRITAIRSTSDEAGKP